MGWIGQVLLVGACQRNAERRVCAVPSAPARTRGAGEHRTGQGVPPGRLPRSLAWVCWTRAFTASAASHPHCSVAQSSAVRRCRSCISVQGFKGFVAISVIGMEAPSSCWTRLWQQKKPCVFTMTIVPKISTTLLHCLHDAAVHFAARKPKIQGRRDRFSSAPASPSLDRTDEDLFA